jgi:hypothetical protein
MNGKASSKASKTTDFTIGVNEMPDPSWWQDDNLAKIIQYGAFDSPLSYFIFYPSSLF